MYGITELKATLPVTEREVACPFHDCQRYVDRQATVFRRDNRFYCNDHRIYISPSTFEYHQQSENILWDYDLLVEHMGFKRESRIARDNSEDGVTWNVFRFLERNGLLHLYLTRLGEIPLRGAKTVYWSYDRELGKPWQPLSKARELFGEDPLKGSEPDLIVLTDQILFIIEAKLSSSNVTRPIRSNHEKQYMSGGDRWWEHAFIPGADYSQIAQKDQKYELMRFWLLGTWMAKRLDREFILLNLVREDSEKDIESSFRKWLPSVMERQFQRITWEDILRFIDSECPEGPEKERIVRYFVNKSLGYRKKDNAWRLQKAFNIGQAGAHHSHSGA